MTDEEPREEALQLDAVDQHKLERFRDLGFNLRQRKTLIRSGADWHEAKKLIDAGCPLDIAFDILS